MIVSLISSCCITYSIMFYTDRESQIAVVDQFHLCFPSTLICCSFVVVDAGVCTSIDRWLMKNVNLLIIDRRTCIKECNLNKAPHLLGDTFNIVIKSDCFFDTTTARFVVFFVYEKKTRAL